MRKLEEERGTLKQDNAVLVSVSWTSVRYTHTCHSVTWQSHEVRATAHLPMCEVCVFVCPF